MREEQITLAVKDDSRMACATAEAPSIFAKQHVVLQACGWERMSAAPPKAAGGGGALGSFCDCRRNERRKNFVCSVVEAEMSGHMCH